MPQPSSTETPQLFRATSPQDLLGTQKPAVHVILKGFLRIAERVFEHGSGRAHPRFRDNGEIDVDRPHHVYLIDGRPGAGKTYTLLSVEYAIRKFAAYIEHGEVEGVWKEFFDKRIFDASIDTENGGANKVASLELLRNQYSRESRRLAATMQVIFPGDLLVNESLMEALFARMAQRLREERDRLEGQSASRWSSGGGEHAPESDTMRRLKELRDLQSELQDKVEQGWYFANRFGLEALIRDSSDYRDLVSRWGEESGKAAARIQHWRAFVHKYLDAFNTTTLVVLVDDSDQRHELTEDILHSIRMFLNHPRIVTIVAGNLKSMRDTLLYRALERLGQAITALNRRDHPAAREWRRRERQTIEEYLAKVLPPEKRIHVSRPVATANPGAREPSDFMKIAKQELVDYQLNALRLTRKPFLKAKFKLALARELERIDAPTESQRSQLEQFLAWWLFTNMYTDVLAPQSARQISTFYGLYNDWFGKAWNKLEHQDFITAIERRDLQPKRLPVMLFDNTANYTLIQRLSDEDASLSDWLRRQPLTSSWSGRRYFAVDGREAHDGSFTYNYMRFRLDAGLSMPIRDNAEEVIPTDLLPHPVGRRFMRRFFQPRQMARRHRRVGVSRWLDHAAVPGNCLYFHDLQAMPDVSFFPNSMDERTREAQQTGAWEAQLADRWHELVEDRHETAEDEYLVRYFCEIVCESLQYTDKLSSAALIGELDPPDINEKRTRAIYEHFLADELGIFSAPRRARRSILRETVAEATAERSMRLHAAATQKPDETNGDDGAGENLRTVDQDGQQFPPASPLRMIALYSALITDLRRAWHAIRVYEALPTHMGGALRMPERDTGKLNSLAIIANRDRMKLFRRENIEELIRQGEWGNRVLNVFGQANLLALFEDDVFKKVIDPSKRAKLFLSEANIKQVYSTTDNEEIIKGSQIIGEDADFKSWTRTLRAIGRAICNKWPVTDAGVGVIDLEGTLFKAEKKRHDAKAGEDGQKPSHVMLKIFRSKQQKLPIDKDERRAAEESLRADEDRRRSNTRAARNLVLLLYGLAPNLPAVIHVDIMSRVYEAELRARALRDAQDPQSNWSNAPVEGEKMRSSIRRLYKTALAEIDEWGKLIGTLAVLVRYIKIKCLHLDTALILVEALKTDASDKAAAAEALALFRHCGYRVEPGEKAKEFDATSMADPSMEPWSEDQAQERIEFQTDLSRKVALDFVKLLRDGWGGNLEDSWPGFQCDTIAEGLAVFPDVSPSSLFGDLWLRDILTRKGVATKVCRILTDELRNAGLDCSVVLQPSKRNQSESDAESHTANQTQGAVEDIDSETDLDDPLSVNGIFGETEQWLWAASRTLRKLRLVLNVRLEAWERTDNNAPSPTKQARKTAPKPARNSAKSTKPRSRRRKAARE